MRGGEKFYQSIDNTRKKNAEQKTSKNCGEYTQPMS